MSNEAGMRQTDAVYDTDVISDVIANGAADDFAADTIGLV